GDDLGVDPIVNNVVAHAPSRDAFRRWVKEGLEDGLRSFVLVGGTSSRVGYPGTSVLEANQILRAAAKRHADVALGNIPLPVREGGPSRSERRGSLASQFRLGGPDRPRVSRVARCQISARGPCLNTIPVFGRASAAKFAAMPGRNGNGKDGPRRMDREVPEVRSHSRILSPRFAGGRPSDRPPPRRRRRGLPGGRGAGILGAAPA